ncbi:MAG TPA: hypothetical protein VFB99_05330, partial [Vicinamibacterales bacterium]|nr:hypothetical protein [Vicinamibacterales bacterium]
SSRFSAPTTPSAKAAHKRGSISGITIAVRLSARFAPFPRLLEIARSRLKNAAQYGCGRASSTGATLVVCDGD